MKAAVNIQYGPPEIVMIDEIERPEQKDNEVLIKVHVSTVNRTDCGFRSAEYFISRFFSGLLYPKYKILGNEFSGEVVGVGKYVTSFNVGNRVFGYNDTTFGAHAEYMCIRETGAIEIIPDNLSFEEAAPLIEGAHYALCNIRAAKVRPGQYVLVNGATGAIGSAAVQILKYYGAIVTAVCDTQNIPLVKALHADFIIDYTKRDFTTIKTKYDFIFDAVGKSSFKKCRKVMKKKGIYISTEFGKNAQNIFFAMITPLFRGKKVLFPIPSINKEDVVFIKRLVEEGKFTAVIDRSYQLTEIVSAYHYVEKGYKTGNVLIKIV